MQDYGYSLRNLISIQTGQMSSSQMSALLRKAEANNSNGRSVFGTKDGMQIRYKPITKGSKAL